jgi:hypothetical protein
LPARSWSSGWILLPETAAPAPTTIFLAGRKRTLDKGGWVRFHRASTTAHAAGYALLDNLVKSAPLPFENFYALVAL